MSILKVDTLQLANGNAPTTKDLGFAAGSVIQVVHAVDTSGQTSTGAQSYVDTGLSATITPLFSTSKVLVIVGQPLLVSVATTSAREMYYRIVRGSTGLVEGGSQFDISQGSFQSTGWFNGLNYLDSPATTSATTYKTQFYVSAGTSDIYANYGSTEGTMTLMEIAQ